MDIEVIIEFISNVEPTIVYLTIFAIAYIENIFPPSPSDVVIIFGGSMVAIGKSNLFITLFSATLGSGLGFVTMYLIGKWFGKKIVDTGKIKIISIESIRKVETWFIKFGYWLIIGNRFLAGTRAIISFFAGISEINLTLTFFLSIISAALWNFILLYGGYMMGRNWQNITAYLQTYWIIVTVIIFLAIITWGIRFIFLKKKISKNG